MEDDDTSRLRKRKHQFSKRARKLVLVPILPMSQKQSGVEYMDPSLCSSVPWKAPAR